MRLILYDVEKSEKNIFNAQRRPIWFAFSSDR